MKKSPLNGTQLAIAAVVMVMVSWVIGVLFATKQVFDPSDIAAWIQAVFSVVAIAAAIWISQSQRRHDQQAQTDAERKSVVGILVLIERGRALTEAMAGIDEGDPSEAMFHSVVVIAEKLESLDLIIRPSPTLLRCSLHAGNYLRVCESLGRERRYRNLPQLVDSLQKSHDQIMKFYGITEDDYPATADW